MAWTLQPRSYMQAIRPNFYSVAYKRNGAYKGMGWLGQEPSGFWLDGAPTPLSVPGQVTGGSCPSSPGCPGYVNPDQNLSTAMEGVLAGQNVFMTTGAFNQLTGASVAAHPASTTPAWVVPAIAAIAIFFALTGGRSR